MREINFQEPAMLLGSAVLKVKEYGPTEEENALAYQGVIERIHKSCSSSILIEGFSLFHNPQFISLLRANMGRSHPRLDMLLCSPLLSRPDKGTTGLTLIDNPLEIVFQEIESGYSNPIEGQNAKSVAKEAIRNGLLLLRVTPEDLIELCVPNSIIVDYEELFIEEVHSEGQTGKFWHLENPFGFLHRYRNEHSQFRKKAKILNVED